VTAGAEQVHRTRTPQARGQDLATRRSWPSPWSVGAFLAYLLIAVALTWPLAIHPASTIYGPPGDLTGTIGTLQLWADHNLNPFVPGQVHAVNAPEGRPMAWAVNLAGISSTVPLYLLASLIGAVAAFAVLTLSGYVASGLAMYLLARKIGSSPEAALVVGGAFAFWPFMILHGQAPHLLGAWVLVLLTWRILRLIESPSRRNGLLAGAAAVFACTWTPYYILFASVIFAFGLLYGTVLSLRTRQARTYANGATMALLPFLAMGGILWLLGHAGIEESAQIFAGTNEVNNSAARLYEYVTPSASNPVFGSLARSFRLHHLHGAGADLIETTIYVGISIIALAAVGVAGARRIGSSSWISVGLMLSIALGALLTSLPPRISLGGVDVTLLSGFIHAHVNSSWRIYSRLSVDVMLGLAVLASLGITRLQASVKRPEFGRIVVAVIAVVVALDIWSQPNASATRLTVPEAYSTLRTLPRGIVAEYPLRRADLSREYWDVFYAHYDRDPIFGGYARNSADEINKMRLGELTPQTSIALASFGVRYVIVRPHATLDPWTVDPGKPAQGFAPVVTGKEVDLYRVTATGYATTDYVSGFYAPELWKGLPRRWMSSVGRLRLTNPNPRPITYRMSGVAFSAHEPHTISVVSDGRSVASFTVATSEGPWSFSLRLPTGVSDVEFRASPSAQPLGGADTRTGTIYLSDINTSPIS
jgi:hypothetical protein